MTGVTLGGVTVPRDSACQTVQLYRLLMIWSLEEGHDVD